MRASVTLVPARRSGGLTHVVAVRGDLARPPVPGAVGQFGPVAALVGLVGGMGRQRIPYVGRCAVRGRAASVAAATTWTARASCALAARKMYVGLWMANRNRRVDYRVTSNNGGECLHRQAERGEGDASRPDDATSGAVRDVPLVGAYRGSSGRGLSPPRAESSGATAASMAAHAPGGLVRRVRAADPSPPRMSARSAKGIERITGNVRSIEPS